MVLDEDIENVLRDENPQAEAVRALIKVRDKEKGVFGSDVELKTDLDKNQVCIHTAADMVSHILDMNKEEFKQKCIMGSLVSLKERKLLSKDRLSRKEIVDIAKKPEESTGEKAESLVKKMFAPRS